MFFGVKHGLRIAASLSKSQINQPEFRKKQREGAIVQRGDYLGGKGKEGSPVQLLL